MQIILKHRKQNLKNRKLFYEKTGTNAAKSLLQPATHLAQKIHKSMSHFAR